jgi:beta-phosphoglucomutase-like phosphatase (HAD superfamily)
MIKAVIFDMGGVILRTVDPTKREAMAKRLGVTRSELEAVVFQSETSVQSELGQLSEAGHWKAVLAYFNQPLIVIRIGTASSFRPMQLTGIDQFLSAH